MAGRRRRRPGSGRSQHFLRRGALAASLVREVDFAATQQVVEIGAGLGALTAALAERFARVRAVEIDPALCARLRRRFAHRAAVDVVRGDFFAETLPRTPWAAVGNLPFHCGSAILGTLASAPCPPHDILAIVEERAALRHSGRPLADEGLRSLWLKIDWHVEITRRLAPRDFVPAPPVRAAALWMARRERSLVPAAARAAFRDLTATLFAAPTLARGLRLVFTAAQIRRLVRDGAFRTDDPPSALALEQWLAIFRTFLREVPGERRAVLSGARTRLPRPSSLEPTEPAQ